MNNFNIKVKVAFNKNEDIVVRFETPNLMTERVFDFGGFPDTAREIRNFLLGCFADLSVKRIVEILKKIKPVEEVK